MTLHEFAEAMARITGEAGGMAVITLGEGGQFTAMLMGLEAHRGQGG